MSSESPRRAEHKMAAPSRRWSATSRAFRTGRASTALVERLHGRLLRHPDAAQPARRDQRPGGAPDRDPAVGPGRPRRDREGDPEERHRAHAERRRDRRAAEHPAADRGASQGPRQESSTSGWRRRGSRSATSGATRPTTSRRKSATGPSGPTSRIARSRRSRRRPTATSPRSTGSAAQGAGGPRGLVARAPLARPTDAPPPAHVVDAGTAARRLDRALADAGRRGAAPAAGRTCRATSRSSWTATGAGPASTTCPSSRATPPASRRSAMLLRHAVRRGVPVMTLYAFSRENWARSDDEVARAVRAARAGDPERDRGAPAQGVRIRLLGRLDELPDDTRRSIDEALAETAGGDPPPPQRRVQLRRPDGARRRRPAARGERRRARRDRRGRDRRRALHRRPAGPGPRDPDRRRAAALELPDLAVGLRGVLLDRGPVARLRRRTPSTRRSLEFASRTRRFGR